MINIIEHERYADGHTLRIGREDIECGSAEGSQLTEKEAWSVINCANVPLQLVMGDTEVHLFQQSTSGRSIASEFEGGGGKHYIIIECNSFSSPMDSGFNPHHSLLHEFGHAFWRQYGDRDAWERYISIRPGADSDLSLSSQEYMAEDVRVCLFEPGTDAEHKSGDQPRQSQVYELQALFWHLICSKLIDTHLRLWIGENYIERNAHFYPADSAPKLIDGHTFVGLRAVSEALGAHVSWDGDDQRVDITQTIQTVRGVE